jgi:hypothetical protein
MLWPVVTACGVVCGLWRGRRPCTDTYTVLIRSPSQHSSPCPALISTTSARGSPVSRAVSRVGAIEPAPARCGAAAMASEGAVADSLASSLPSVGPAASEALPSIVERAEPGLSSELAQQEAPSRKSLQGNELLLSLQGQLTTPGSVSRRAQQPPQAVLIGPKASQPAATYGEGPTGEGAMHKACSTPAEEELADRAVPTLLATTRTRFAGGQGNARLPPLLHSNGSASGPRVSALGKPPSQPAVAGLSLAGSSLGGSLPTTAGPGPAPTSAHGQLEPLPNPPFVPLAGPPPAHPYVPKRKPPSAFMRNNPMRGQGDSQVRPPALSMSLHVAPPWAASS